MKVIYKKSKKPAVSYKTVEKATSIIVGWLLKNKRLLSEQHIRIVEDKIGNIHFFYVQGQDKNIICDIHDKDGGITVYIPNSLLKVRKNEMVKEVKRIIKEKASEVKQEEEKFKKQEEIIQKLKEAGVEVIIEEE